MEAVVPSRTTIVFFEAADIYHGPEYLKNFVSIEIHRLYISKCYEGGLCSPHNSTSFIRNPLKNHMV